jgi:O-antigen/teichoic acid export membrane protein
MKWTTNLNRDGLFSHGILVMFLLHMASAANLVFHMAMGRLLDSAEYGVLAAMLGAFFIFYTPLFFSIQNTLSHFSKHLLSENRREDVRYLVWKWVKKTAAVAAPLLFVVLALSSVLAKSFHLDSIGPIVLMAVILFVSILMPIFSGALQGLEKFAWMAAGSHGWTIVRLGAGILLVGLLSPTVEVAFIAHLLGVLICLWVGLRGLCRAIPNPVPTGKPIEKVGGYFFGSLAALFFYAVLMNAGVVMVKIFFPDEAVYGPYARAFMIGRMVVFLSLPLASVLFPKVSARQGMTSESLGSLLKAVILSSILVGGIVGFFLIWPCVPLAAMFGDWNPLLETMNLVRWVVLSMSPLGLVFLVMNFELAQNRFALLLPVGAFALLFVVGFSLYHPSVIWVAFWLLAATSLSLLSLIGLVAWQKKRVHSTPR